MEKQNAINVKLNYPVQLPDKVLSEVTIRRPLVRDMIKHQMRAEMTLKESVNLLADLCDLNPEDMELLDTSDYENLMDAFLSFRGVAK